jgi:hypothetical protein
VHHHHHHAAKKKHGVKVHHTTVVQLPPATHHVPPFLDEKACAQCGEEFSFFLWEHHCRACGHAVCDDHSTHRQRIPAFAYHEPVRVCDSCYHALQDGSFDYGHPIHALSPSVPTSETTSVTTSTSAPLVSSSAPLVSGENVVVVAERVDEEVVNKA